MITWSDARRSSPALPEPESANHFTRLDPLYAADLTVPTELWCGQKMVAISVTLIAGRLNAHSIKTITLRSYEHEAIILPNFG